MFKRVLRMMPLLVKLSPKPIPQTLSEWLTALAEQRTRHSRIGIERIRIMCERLSIVLPPSFPVITVTGTNGKGSVVATLESLAKTYQLNIGSFTSPHLLQYNERICFNAQPVSDTLIVSAFEKIAEVQEDLVLSYFDYSLLAALLIFLSKIEKKCLDLIVLEVGIGGLNDAVNAIEPSVSIITSVGLDHREILGETREEIGLQKAGILRSNKPAILGKDLPHTVLSYAHQIKAEIDQLGTDFSITYSCDRNGLMVCCLEGIVTPEVNFISCVYPDNAALAVRAFGKVFPQIALNPQAIKTAFEGIHLKGRQQTFHLEKGRLLLFDVAHNQEALQLLNHKIISLIHSDKYQECKPPIWVLFACKEDKWNSDLLSCFHNHKSMAPFIHKWLLAPLSDNASLFMNIVNSLAKQSCHLFDSVEQAFIWALEALPAQGILVVCGSFLTVSRTIRIYLDQTQRNEMQ